MAFVVTQACVGCKDTSCVVVCPVDAFHEGRDRLLINPETCICCGACEAECPVEAIYDEEFVPDSMKPFIEINRIESPKYPVISEYRSPKNL